MIPFLFYHKLNLSMWINAVCSFQWICNKLWPQVINVIYMIYLILIYELHGRRLLSLYIRIESPFYMDTPGPMVTLAQWWHQLQPGNYLPVPLVSIDPCTSGSYCEIEAYALPTELIWLLKYHSFINMITTKHVKAQTFQHVKHPEVSLWKINILEIVNSKHKHALKWALVGLVLLWH